MRRITKILLVFLLCILAAGGWFYLHKDTQAENAIKKQLAALGLDVKDLKVTGCGLDSCSITTLRIGEDDLNIENAAVRYSASGLLDSRIDSLLVDSLLLHVKKDADGWSIGGYKLAIKEDDSTAPRATIPAFPFRMVTIKSLSVVLDDGVTKNLVVMENVKLDAADAPKFKASIASITHNVPAPAILPLSLEVEGTNQDGALAFAGSVKDTQSRGLQIIFKGEANVIPQTLKFDADMATLTFDTGVLQPSDIVPLTKGLASGVKGQVSGTVSWEKNAKTAEKQNATLVLKQLSANLAGVGVNGADGVLHFNSFGPLLTDGKQTVKVDRLDAGVPLLKGAVQFELGRDGMVVLYPMKWDWSGGSLVTDRMNIKPGQPLSEQIRLHVRQIDLNSLLALVLDKGIEAQGRLDGTIPIRFSKGNVIIDNASLSATGPGRVVYKPSDPSIAQSGGEQTKLLMQALENFQFKLLSMTVNSKEDGNSVIGLKISGNNPDLYEGKAIELNVNLQGRLEEIIKQNMDALALPSQIEKQLQEKNK